MIVVTKILLTIAALLSGPIVILLIYPFYDWHMTSGIMTMALTSGMAVYGLWSKPKKEVVPNRLCEFVRRCWKGEQQLWEIFWLVGIGFAAVLKGVSYLGTAYHAPLIWWIAVLTLAVPIQLWWIVSVWRCAQNTGKKIWTVLARIVAGISAAYSAYTIFLVVAYPFGI